MTSRMRAASAITAALLASPAAAADTIFTTDISGGVGYSAQPFVGRKDGAVGGKGSTFYEAAIRPRLERRGSTSSLVVSGSASIQDFFGNYRSSDAYGAGVSYDARVSERLNAGVRLDYDNAVLGAGGAFSSLLPIGGAIGTIGGGGLPSSPITGPVVPFDPAIVTPPDLGLFGTGIRRELFSASGNVGYALSALDSLSASVFYSDSSYTRTTLNQGPFHSYGGTLGYQRRLSESLSVGLQGSASRNVFTTPPTTSDVRSVQGTINWQLDTFWTLSGSGGVTFIDGQRAAGKSSTASGNAQLCRRGEFDRLCVSASRAVVPTAFAGTQTQTSFTASYSRQVDAASTVQGDVSYTRSNAGAVLVPGASGDFLSVNASYSRRLGQRLRAVAGAFYRDVSNGLGLGSDYGGRLGLSFTLGDVE